LGGSAGPPHPARDLKAVRQTLTKQLSKSPEGTIVLLDLGEALLRASELGALLTEPIVGIVQGNYRGRYLVVRDNDGQNVWEGDAALRMASDLRGQSLAVAWRAGAGSTVPIGRVDPLIQDTYEFVSSASSPSEATARQLAETRSVSVQAASNRLSRASRLGLIHAIDRIPAAGGGSQFAYVAIT